MTTFGIGHGNVWAQRYDGNYQRALEEDVRLNTPYGSNGNEYLGQLEAAVDVIVPVADDIREGVLAGPVESPYAGNLHSPPENKVLLLYGYDSNGTARTGTLQALRTENECLKLFTNEEQEIFIPLRTDYSAKEQTLFFSDPATGSLIETINDGDLNKTAAGTGFNPTPAITGAAQELNWALRLTASGDGDEVIAYGVAHIYTLPGGT